LQARWLGVPAVLLLVVGLFSVWIGAWEQGALALVVGFIVLWRARVVTQHGRAVTTHNAAVERLLRGEIDEAETLLARIPPALAHRSHLGRAGGLVRARIAFYRGDITAAIALATAAIAIPYSAVERSLRPVEQGHRARLLALRALALASLGDAAAAERDAAESESHPATAPEVLARAALARAVTLSRAKNNTALAAHLGKTQAILLEFLTPRERALARALRRMARAEPKSVYREPARPDEQATEEARLAAWIGQLAPGAQEFVVPDGPASPHVVPPQATACATLGSASLVSHRSRPRHSAPCRKREGMRSGRPRSRAGGGALPLRPPPDSPSALGCCSRSLRRVLRRVRPREVWAGAPRRP
jgi:hypothetical protein